MAKNRFESLSKNDREWVFRWTAIHTEIRRDVRELLGDRASEFRAKVRAMPMRLGNQAAVDEAAADLFSSEMFFISGRLICNAIVRRLLDDDVTRLYNDAVLSARVGYLQDLAATPKQSGGYDCLHVFDIFRAYAVLDRRLVAAYVSRHPGPSMGGHPFTKLLCNAVTAVLRKTDDLATFPQRLRQRKDGSYDDAMLQCIAGIIEGDRRQVSDCFDQLLKNYRRKTVDDGPLRFFPLQLHGIYNFICDALSSLHQQPVIDAPVHPLWDAEFQSMVSREPTLDALDVLSVFSSTIAMWADTLPTRIRREEFSRLAEPADQ